MSLFDWFANRRKSGPISQERQERDIADGLWSKCVACGVLAYTKDLRANQMVCPECGYETEDVELWNELVRSNSVIDYIFPVIDERVIRHT